MLAVGSVGTYFWADSKLHREVDLSKVEDRPPQGKGTNYLIVGSDSREGLSAREKKELHTGGSAEGRRTDSMMILHTGDNGTTMMSLPRDSWVTIPSFIRPETGKHYRAVEEQAQRGLLAAAAPNCSSAPSSTTRACTSTTTRRSASRGFVGHRGRGRRRADVPGQGHQGQEVRRGPQEGLPDARRPHRRSPSSASATRRPRATWAAARTSRSSWPPSPSKAATPGTLLNPFKLYPTMGAGLDTLIVDKDMSLPNLASMFWAMKGVTGGDGKRLTVPVSEPQLPAPPRAAP